MFVVYELSVLLSVWMWVSLWWVRTTTLSVLVYYNTRVQDNIYNSNYSKISVETGRCNFTWLSTQSGGQGASLIHEGTLWTFIRSLIVVFLAWKVFNSDNFLYCPLKNNVYTVPLNIIQHITYLLILYGCIVWFGENQDNKVEKYFI